MPEWLQTNFMLGFFTGCVFTCIFVALDWLWKEVLKPRRAEKRKRRGLEKAKKARVRDEEHLNTVRAGQGDPHAAPPPARRRDPLPVEEHPATAAIEEQPGLETQAMPAVQPSQFRRPPPPLPRPYEGPERRNPEPEPYEGEERRGRHSDPEDRRRRRRDDPWERDSQ
jgi:hypothetical protein